MAKATDVVEYNGELMTLAQVAEVDPIMAKGCGYGHFNPWSRPTIPTSRSGIEYPWTPDTCEYADKTPDEQYEEGINRWIEDGQILVCTGCGIDGT